MSNYEFDTDQNSGRQSSHRVGVGRRLLTLAIVVAIAAVAVWAMVRAGAQHAQPGAPETPVAEVSGAESETPSGNEVIEEPAVVVEESSVSVDEPEITAVQTVGPVEAETTTEVVATVPDESVQESAPVPAEPVPSDEPAGKGGAVPAADSETQQLYQAAGTALAAHDFVKARDLARQALARPDMNEKNPLRNSVLAILGKANATIALTPAPAPEKVTHRIADGDSVSVLARKFGTTSEAIALSNNLKDPNRIMIGYNLKIYPAKWSIAIDLAHRTLTLMNDGALFKVYDVGVGRDGKTPTGTFRISDRIEKPAWTSGNRQIPYGDPANVLGTRWMPLAATGETQAVSGIGLHGTWDDATVSQPVSNGCVRLHNADVEELFNLVPVNTPVTIQ